MIADVRVEGNLLASSPERSGLIIAMEDEGVRGNHIDGGIVRNVLIDHNTFYQNGRQGITIYDDVRVNGITVTNNLIDQSENTNCLLNCSWYQIAHVERGAKAQHVTVSHNAYAPGPAMVFGVTDTVPSTGIAAFVGPSVREFHLSSNSVAIDAGSPQSPEPLDFDGQTRTVGAAPDAGAFEFGTGAPPQPTPVPRQKLFVPVIWR